ncbi:MAG TPA: hypothetical protein VGV38_14725, partial [Pyrinomonadaceae bacterium]|nr:hypothetical protein [Pyrinomonadaceae bacterium]
MHQPKALVAAALVFLLALASAARAQDRLLTIEDIYDPEKSVNFDGTPPTNLRWLKPGTHYLQARRDASGQSRLMRVEARTGEAAPFHDIAQMERAFGAVQGVSAEDARRLARRSSYDFNPAETGALLNHSNDLFFYSFADGRAVRLTNNRDEESVEEFS